MKTHHSSTGVTLVEIAIVMLIIGGLIGAILGYREVIRITYLKKTATEVQNIGTVARTFEQKYDALPGDYADASEKIRDCTVDGAGNPTNPNFCRNGNGDGRIGRYCHFTWSECFQTGSVIPGSDPSGNSIPPAVPLETSMFWKHLYLAGLIGGIVDPLANPANPTWFGSHPGSAIEGAGYVIGGGDFVGGSVVVNMIPTPTTSPQGNGNDLPGQRALSIRDAAWLDEKYDNGGPGSGTLWWRPINPPGSGTGCLADDGGQQNTWESVNVDSRNCDMTWSAY